MNYYNEFEPKAAAALKQLISDGLIPRGNVDDRSITEIRADELKGYTQCHFFAGIGGWSRALELAGWPADRPVWTGSCPCQPFSTAGKQKVTSITKRHTSEETFFLLLSLSKYDITPSRDTETLLKGTLDEWIKQWSCKTKLTHTIVALHIMKRKRKD